MSPALTAYGSLAIAIALEVLGTTLLHQSQQFSRIVPTAIMLVCYVTSLFFLSVSLKTIPVGIAYGIWSGLGIVLISTVGYVLFRQVLDTAAIVGLGMIIGGVMVINIFSNSIQH